MSRKSTLMKKNVLEICSDERLNQMAGSGKNSWKKGNINWAVKSDDLKGLWRWEEGEHSRLAHPTPSLHRTEEALSTVQISGPQICEV